MRWECTECGAELARVNKPRACPECGMAALFVRAESTMSHAELEPDDLRAGWLSWGLRRAAEGSAASV
jgi:DNA-directed RNA polymerase subunit RPC12/RpoP